MAATSTHTLLETFSLQLIGQADANGHQPSRLALVIRWRLDLISRIVFRPLPYEKYELVNVEGLATETILLYGEYKSVWAVGVDF